MNMALEEFQDNQKTLQDYLAVLKRRWLQILLPAVVLFLLAAVVAFMLPATYRSTATILIEEQEIPRDLVRSTITSYAAQQVQVISRRIMTVENVSQIAEKYDLYKPKDGSKLPSTEVVKLFGANMAMDLISADVIDPRSGRPTEATIAFTLSFKHGNPSTSQKVTNELVTFYLNENLRTRSNKAQSTAQFLTAEADSLNAELVAIEEALATFKQTHEGALPELYQYNLSVVDRTDRELSDISLRLNELKKIRIELAAERAQINPAAPLRLRTGEVVLDDPERLKVLQSEYRNKSSLYKDNHPDLLRLKRELDDLRATVGGGLDSTQLAKELALKRNELSVLNSRYKAGNPAISKAEREVRLLEQDLRAAQASQAPAPSVSDNPAYVYVDTQIKSADAEIRALGIKRNELQQKIQKFDALILKAPQVEKEYQALLRDYNSAQLKFQEIKAKQREASLAENLEQERKGERFTLVEPPSLPLKPVSPNRPAIVLLGFILAGAVGLGSGLLAEALDPSIKGEKALAAALGNPVLAVVPYLENNADKQAKRRKLILLLLGVLLLGSAAVGFVHLYIKPLDVLWFVLLQRAGMG